MKNATKERNITEFRDESGIALIAVMTTLLLIAILASSITTLALISNQVSKVTCDIAESAYIAEGAADRTLWLLKNDRTLHPGRNLGNYDYLGADESEPERFMADGTEHKMDYYGGTATVRILDAASGIEISGSSPQNALRLPQQTFDDDTGKWERYKTFLDRVKDYTDSNDLVSLNGMEKKDYADAGLAPLPRNARMKYREEILFIPGSEEFFHPDRNGILSSFRIPPQYGLRSIRGKNNFFSVSEDTLKKDTHFSDDEYLSLIEARKKWETGQIPLSELLDPALLRKVKQRYSMRESGYYTIIVKASPGPGLPGRTFTYTLYIPGRSSNLTTGKTFRYYNCRFLK